MTAKNTMSALAPILAGLTTFSTAIGSPLKAAKDSIAIETKYHQDNLATCEANIKALKERHNEEFSALRAERKSLQETLAEQEERNSTEGKVTTASTRKAIEANINKWNGLVVSSREEIQQAYRLKRQIQGCLTFLSDLQNGFAAPQKYEGHGAASAAVERLRRVVRGAVGDLMKALTNPEHGGYGMPRNKDGGFGGLATFVRNGQIVELSAGDMNTLLDTVARLRYLGVRFTGEGREEAWNLLVAAVNAREGAKAIEAAAAAPTVSA